MKKPFLAVLTALALSVAIPASAEGFSIKKSGTSILPIEGYLYRDESATGPTLETAFAVATVNGMVEALNYMCDALLSDKRGTLDTEKYALSTKGVGKEQLLQTFVNWMRANPKAWDEPLIAATVWSLRDDYPCK